MTTDNNTDVLQTIAEALLGIQVELKAINRTLAKSEAANASEAPAGRFNRSEDRPKRPGLGGKPRFGKGPGGKSSYGEGRPSKPYKGGGDKPSRKPRSF